MDSKRNMEQGRVMCRICRKSYSNNHNFKSHQRQRHSQNSFCVLCQHYLGPDETASSHLFNHHNIRITSACDCCNWTFSNQHEAERHCDRMEDKRWKAMCGQDLPAVINDCPAGCFLNPSVGINEEYRDSLMAWVQNERMNSDTPEDSIPLSPSSDPGSSSSVSRGETLSYEAWSVGLFQNLNFKFSNVVKLHVPNMNQFLAKKAMVAQHENSLLWTPPILDFSRFEQRTFSPPIMDPADLTSEIQKHFPKFAPRLSADESGGSRGSVDLVPGTSSVSNRTNQDTTTNRNFLPAAQKTSSKVKDLNPKNPSTKEKQDHPGKPEIQGETDGETSLKKDNDKVSTSLDQQRLGDIGVLETPKEAPGWSRKNEGWTRERRLKNGEETTSGGKMKHGRVSGGAPMEGHLVSDGYRLELQG